jgi:hypothetical protein
MLLKSLVVTTWAAMILASAVASSASATTLEVGGVIQNKAVTIEASATAGTSFAKTDGVEAATCSVSSLKGTTSVFSGSKVTGSLGELSFKTCTREPVVVDAAGGMYFEYETETTSGNVYSEGAEWTVPTNFGFNVICSTAAGTKLGTVDGVASSSAHATLTVNALINCGFLLPSAILKGTYRFSSPTGLGVVS